MGRSSSTSKTKSPLMRRNPHAEAKRGTLGKIGEKAEIETVARKRRP